MLKSALLLTVLSLLFTSCGQEDTSSINTVELEVELTQIQMEREAMHQKYIKSIQYNKIPQRYDQLLKKDIKTYNARDWEKRISYGWRLGKVEQLKIDHHLFIMSPFYEDVTDGYSDWRKIIRFSEHKPSEWHRLSKMADVIHNYFKQKGDVSCAQDMLGIKIQAAKLMGDSTTYLTYLQEMTSELEKSDPRYKTYESMIGWWYQDQGLWNESIELFQARYDSTKSLNMLGSLVWGLFNAGRYSEVIEYEEELWKKKDFISNYILGKSYGEIGNEEKKKRYYEKYKTYDYIGRGVSVYYLKERDEKFYYYKQDYLQEIAEYFEAFDPEYACTIYKEIARSIESSLQPSYNSDRYRDVILAQEDPVQQQLQNEKYLTLRGVWHQQLLAAQKGSKNCK